MLHCFKSKNCELKEVLQILCCARTIECKQGSFKKIIEFVKKKKAKSVILLIKGNLKKNKAKQYIFLIQEAAKVKKLIWAMHKDKKLSFKLLLAF